MSERDAKGRWTPGTSGCPSGPPSGAARLRAQLREYEPAIIDKLLELALAGNEAALTLVCARLFPVPRAVCDPVQIHGLAEAATLTDKAQCILTAAARGDVPPDVAERLLGALSGYARAVEVDELERRVRALEVGDLI